MKRNFLILALAIAAIITTSSCQKSDAGGTSELQKKALELESKLTNNNYIPVDFYSDSPIDYMEDDAAVLAETDLKKYIYPYLTDDVITFNPNKTLTIDQGEQMIQTIPQSIFQRTWSTETSKSRNEVYLNYLDYFYDPRRYTLVEFTDTTILAYVDWTSKADPTKKAKLFTRFRKK